MSVFSAVGQVWAIARKVEEILELQTKARFALAAIGDRLDRLEDRMTHLEANQDMLVTEAKAAAGVAATGLAGSILSDAVTRITRLEVRLEDSQHRLPPPAG